MIAKRIAKSTHRRGWGHAAMLAAVLLVLTLAPALPAHAQPPSQPHFSPGDLIAGVNSLRASNGLGALKSNSALNAAAQAQSDYQAATGTISHTGKGGSNPRGRAQAYGYGGGAAIYVSENIAAGMSMSASGAVSIWTGDSLHLGTMLNAAAVDIGAGEASNGDLTYYTILVGYVAGEVGSAPAVPAAPASGAAGAATGGATAAAAPPAAAPTLAVIKTVRLATPGPDGTLVHVVEEGQALWNIATAYKVGLAELLAQNGLTDTSLIFPGEKLVIRRGAGATEASSGSPSTETTAAPSATSENPPTVTPRNPPTVTPSQATITPSEVVLAVLATTERPPEAKLAAASLGESAAVAASLPEQPVKDPLLLAVGSLLIAGALLLIFGTLLRRG